MRIVFLTGIWPPDVGGPATHGPEFAHFLAERGHEVVVVTMGDGRPSVEPCEVVVVSRSSPFPVRYGRVAAVATRRARTADVIYATATYAAARVASGISRTPLAVKLVSDPAYERARRYGFAAGTLEDFQQPGTMRVEALKRARSASLRRARAIVVPSAYLAAIAGGWGLDAARLSVLPNPAPASVPDPVAPEQGTFVFVGRLTEQKDLGVAIEAIGRVDGTRLIVIGDGPDRGRLEELAASSAAPDRIVFRGSLSRAEALAAVARSEAALLTSAWENFPHSVVEALAAGVPVISTAVGGVPEIVRDELNGLLVPIGDVDAVARALVRITSENDLRTRLAAASRASVESLSATRVYGRLEAILADVADG